MDGLISEISHNQKLQRPHAVLIPLPVQSHVNPFTAIARLLVDNGVFVTFVYTSRTYKQVTSASDNSSESLKSNEEDDFYRIEVLSDETEYGGSADNKNFDTFISSLDQIRVGTEKLLQRYLARGSDEAQADGYGGSSVKTHVSALIIDSFIPWGWKVADKFGLRKIDLWTSNAVLFNLGLHVPVLRERGFLPQSPLSDEEKQRVVDFIPGLTAFRVSDLPCMWLSDPTPNNVILEFTMEVFRNIKHTDRTLLNSIYEMEQHTIDAVRDNYNIRLDCIGPLPSANTNINKNNCAILGSFLREDTSCLTWLDTREPGTVLYVSFGSLAQLDPNVLAELALGVEASGVAFLWVARPGLVKGDAEIFPAGFRDRTAGRGLVVEWAPQQTVLAHSSVGAFLSHCGWNSTIESLAAGVPILGLPISAEQNTNFKHIVNDWRVGLPLIPGLSEYPPAPGGYTADICGRTIVEASVGNVMADGDIRQQAMKWKSTASAAVADDPAGSSYRNLQSLVRDLGLS